MAARRGQMLTVEVRDSADAAVEITFFNPRAANTLKPGMLGMFAGKVGEYHGRIQLTNPEFAKLDADSEDAGDTDRQLGRRADPALSEHRRPAVVEDRALRPHGHGPARRRHRGRPAAPAGPGPPGPAPADRGVPPDPPPRRLAGDRRRPQAPEVGRGAADAGRAGPAARGAQGAAGRAAPARPRRPARRLRRGPALHTHRRPAPGRRGDRGATWPPSTRCTGCCRATWARARRWSRCGPCSPWWTPAARR